MYRFILLVAGTSMLLLLGGRLIIQNRADAQDSSQPVADTYADYAKRSLQVGDHVLYAHSTVVLLTKEQSTKLSTYPRNLATVTGIGKDYFVARADVSRDTFSQALGTRMIERVVRFDAITEFQKYVNGIDQPQSPSDP